MSKRQGPIRCPLSDFYCMDDAKRLTVHASVPTCFHEVNYFLIMDTLKGITLLVPWPLMKEINIKAIISSLILLFFKYFFTRNGLFDTLCKALSW